MYFFALTYLHRIYSVIVYLPSCTILEVCSESQSWLFREHVVDGILL